MEVGKNTDAELSFDKYYEKVSAALKKMGYETQPDHNDVAADYGKELSVSESVEEFVNAWGDPDFEPEA